VVQSYPQLGALGIRPVRTKDEASAIVERKPTRRIIASQGPPMEQRPRSRQSRQIMYLNGMVKLNSGAPAQHRKYILCEHPLPAPILELIKPYPREWSHRPPGPPTDLSDLSADDLNCDDA
jgi:hypothetical protein